MLNLLSMTQRNVAFLVFIVQEWVFENKIKIV